MIKRRQGLIILLMLVFSFSCLFSTTTLANPFESEESEITFDPYTVFINNLIDHDTRKINYPDYFGGAYFDSDGNLFIYVTNITKNDNIESIKKLSNSDNFTIVESVYSFNYLLSIMDEINQYLEKFAEENNSKDKTPLFSAAGIDSRQNCILVFMNDMSEDAIKKFKAEVSNSKAITFTKFVESDDYSDRNNIEDAQENSVNRAWDYIYCGTQIKTNSTYASLGYAARVKVNGVYIGGYMTTAHGQVYNSQVLLPRQQNKRIGSFLSQYAKNQGNVDAIFVKYEALDDLLPLTMIEGTSYDHSNVINGAAVGTTVKRAGAEGPVSTGTVAINPYSFYSNSISYTNFIATQNITFDQGDSGGPLFVASGTSGQVSIAGIWKGSYGAYGVATSALQIYEEWGLWPHNGVW